MAIQQEHQPNRHTVVIFAIIVAASVVICVSAMITHPNVVLQLSSAPYAVTVQAVPQTVVGVVVATPTPAVPMAMATAIPATPMVPQATASVLTRMATPTLPHMMTATPMAVQTTSQLPASSAPTLVPETTITSLPQIKTATPLPSLPVTITIMDGEATARAKALVQSEDLALSDIHVIFTESEIRLTGSYNAGLLPISVEATAQPLISDERLHLQVTSLKLGGASLPDRSVQLAVERALNAAFDQLLRGKRVQSFDLALGGLTITVLQQP